MVEEKRILSYFIGYVIIGLFICFIGLSNVFASTYYLDYSYSQKYFDNYGTSVTGVTTTWNESLQSYISDDITTAAGSYGAGLSITSPIPILENHTYTLSIYFEEINNIALSSKNYLAFSSTLQGAANNYANGEYDNDLITSSVSNNSILNFAFTSKRNGSYIFIPWTTTSTVTQSYLLTQIQMEDLGSEGVSIDDINSSLTNQTNELNSSIQESTNTITDSITETEGNINSNIDDMESAIVDSNKETQEVIKDQFNNCRDSYNLINFANPGLKNNVSSTFENNILTISSSGYSSGSNRISFNILDLVKNNPGKTISFSYENLDISNYTSTASVIVQLQIINNGASKYPALLTKDGIKTSYTIPDDTSLITSAVLHIHANNTSTYVDSTTVITKPMFQIGTNSTTYELYGEEICTNKLDETNNQLGDLNSNLTDSSPTDMSGLGDSAGWLPAGPVDSILTLPLTMLNSLVSNLTNNSCQTISVELPFVKENITLPCVRSLYDKMGVTGTLFTTAGLIASAFILFNYLLALYKWVDDTLTMRENTMPGYFEDNWGGGA